MTVVLFGEQRAGEADDGGVVGEDPDDVGAAADLFVDTLQGVGGPQLGPVLGGQVVEGDEVLLGLLQEPAHLRSDRGEALEHVPDALASLGVVFGVEDLSERGGDQAALVAAAVGQHVSDEVHGAPLQAPSNGRPRNSSTCSSSPRHIAETRSLVIPSIPSCSTSRSTFRVETPLT